MGQRWALPGAILGAGMGFLLACLNGKGYWSAELVAGIVLALYAAAYVGGALASAELRYVMLGWCAGLNGAVNASLLFWFLQPLGVDGLAIACGVIACLLSVLSCVPFVAHQRTFQCLLAWSVWVLPMAWPVQAAGIFLLALNLLGHVVAYPPLSQASWRVNGVDADARMGTIFVCGGRISNLNALRTAFNLGSLNFVHSQSPSWYAEHETGHTLSLGAFGALFHLFGAIEEILLNQGSRSLAERVAESHYLATRQSDIVPVWGPGIPPTQVS